MELWIRNQDKTFLRKVNTIGIVEGRDFWSIDESLTVSFGKYKTKERALEVLDEIQHILNPIVDRKILEIEQKDLLNGTNFIQPKLKDIEISEFNTYVYEMPKE